MEATCARAIACFLRLHNEQLLAARASLTIAQRFSSAVKRLMPKPDHGPSRSHFTL